MDVSDKVVSSSTHTKPSQIPKDENDDSYQEMGQNLMNQKKPPTTKNYMSPTVSAASKATLPRKKILAESNQLFDTNHLQKTPNLENSNESLSQNTPLSSDSFSKPYDPVTNYLSPRPKFLRYKPNRRREIFLDRKNERKEGNDGLISISTSASFDSKNDIDDEGVVALVCSSLEGFGKREDEEFDESDDEFEEVEEEKGWGLRGVLKFLLVLFVLVVTTSYISSMNSPTTPSFAVQAIEGLKDRYHVNEFVKSFEDGSQFLNGTQMGSMELNHNIVDEGIEGEEANSDDLSEMVELQSGKSEDVEIVEGEKKGEVDELSEGAELQSGENEAVEVDEGEKKGGADELSGAVELQSGENEAVEVLEGEKKGGADELSEIVEPQAAEIDDVCDNETAKSGEVIDQMTENVESPEIETVEKFESLQDSQVLIISDGVEKENGIIMEPVEEVYNEEPRDKDQVDGKMNGTENIINDYSNFEIVNPEAEVNPKDGLIELVETELYLKVVIGVSIFSMIVASLVLGFRVMKKKIVTKDSSKVIKSCTESVIAEKSNTVLFNQEKKNVIKGSSLVIEPYTQSVNAEKSTSMLHFNAPSVEFLGEFKVGEVSSSLRSCGMKSRMVESEVGSHSVSWEKGYGPKAHSMPNQVHPAFSEFSTMISPSYGSFSAENQILKKQKQESGDGDGKKVVVTTPVRRSSRIRNRAVSP